ncbi:MAG: right-handed parallel beta-helix repeat-containing protein [Bacteroidota bacterium]
MKEKIFTTVFFLIAFSFYGKATTYYLSSSTGDDTSSGTNSVAPWKSLNHLNTVTLFPGDSVLLKAGDTFFGTIILNNSGVFNNPIYFGKYGIGVIPVITGFKKLTGWISTGNIYSVSDTDNVKSIWFNGKWMQPARFPNSGFLSTENPNYSTAVFNDQINQPNGYWDGASIAVRSCGFKYEIGKVDTSFSGVAILSQATDFQIPQYNGFFFYNKLSELDTANEWFLDTVSNQVFLIPPPDIDFVNASIEASLNEYGIFSMVNLSDLVFDSIEFTGQAKDGFHFNGSSTRISIKNCVIKMCKEWAISFQSTTSNCNVLGNQISNCTGGGIFSLFFYQCNISNNRLTRIGIQDGFGFEKFSQGIAINLASAIYDTVANNLIDSCGYSGITIYQFGNKIVKNRINFSMLNLNDGAAILFYDPVSHTNYISDNFISNTIGNVTSSYTKRKVCYGIYLKPFCNNDLIIHNTIINGESYGIFIDKYNHHQSLSNNVLYNNNQGQIFIADGDTNLATNNIQLHHNILYSLSEKQKVLQLNGSSLNFLPVTGDSNYYCTPFDYFPIYQQSNQDTVIIEKPFSLKKWNQTTQQDSNSHFSNVVWQNYATTDTTGSDEIVNGDFTNNYDGWHTQPLNENSLLLDNLTMMDGGCVKFQIPDTAQSNSEKIISTSFPILQNQFYQFGFSVAAKKSTTILADIAMPVYPYYLLGMRRYFPIDTARKNYDFIFASDIYGDPLVLNLEMEKQDSLVYFDNIRLMPVTVFKHDSTRMSVLLMNYSPNTTTVTLPSDSVFRDLDGNIVPGSYTLPPYSSYVLVLDSPLNLVSVKEIQKENTIVVFPNPVQSSLGKIFIQLPDADKYNFEIYDVLGQKQQYGKFLGAMMNSVSVKNYAAGLYILNIHSAKKQWQQKIIVVN